MTVFVPDTGNQQLNLVLEELANNVVTGAVDASTGNSIYVANDNSIRAPSGTVIGYLNRYLWVTFADDVYGTNASSQPTNRTYFGILNTSNTSNVPNNFLNFSYTATAGFGNTKYLFYQTTGGRSIDWDVNTSPISNNWVRVNVGPTYVPIDLDEVSAAGGQPGPNGLSTVVGPIFQANADTPPTISSNGTYDFITGVLTPPTGWVSEVPANANTLIWTSQATFSTFDISNPIPNTTPWTTPAIAFQSGGAGPAGSRGFIPLAYVITATNPTSYTDAEFSSAFSAPRANTVAPIGTGYSPIAGDTASFSYSSGNTRTTVVRTFNGINWTPAQGQVVDGNLIVTNTITASQLNATSLYALNIQSTNANFANNTGNGYWLQANTGNAYFAGNVYIGNNLTVAGLITSGNISSNARLNSNTVNTIQVVDQAINTLYYQETGTAVTNPVTDRRYNVFVVPINIPGRTDVDPRRFLLDFYCPCRYQIAWDLTYYDPGLYGYFHWDIQYTETSFINWQNISGGITPISGRVTSATFPIYNQINLTLHDPINIYSFDNLQFRVQWYLSGISTPATIRTINLSPITFTIQEVKR